MANDTMTAMARTVATWCRLCESACGLLVEVEGDRVLRIRPDDDHPISRGHVCAKGTGFARVHHHPDRLRAPRVDGRRTTWEEAIPALGARLADLRRAHGPDAIGVYTGNAAGWSLGAILGAQAFLGAIGSRKSYSCLTLDNSEIFVVTEACLGNPMLTFVADYARSDLVVLVGTDPLSSQPSQMQSHPRGLHDLLEKGRAGQLVVIDPRRSLTAARAAVHLAPRVSSDVFLLAWLCREVLDRRPPRDPLLDDEDVRALVPALAPFSLERAVRETGLPAEDLERLRDRLLAAERPIVWCGLGVLLGPDGTVGYWLTLTLQALLGGLDREGGWRMQRGAFDLPRFFRRFGPRGHDGEHRSRRGHPAVLGTLAAATLADDILAERDPLRALVVIGGNPARSLPDTRRAIQALSSLELLISIDLFENDTGALAHAVLPARSFLSRADTNLHLAQQRPAPHVQVGFPVVADDGDTREDWTILTALARAAGRPLFGSRVIDALLRAAGAGPLSVARLVISALTPLSWRAVAAAERGLVAPERPGLRATGTDHRDGSVHLAVPAFVAALRGPLGPRRPPGSLALLTSIRPPTRMNTWLPRATPAPAEARVHPRSLGELGVRHGDAAVLRDPSAPERALEVILIADDALAPGVVAVAFGQSGANTLVGTDTLEPFTGQPVSNGKGVYIDTK
jgi:anaerobic selenocysteine-containing dehydrogenase